MKCSLLWLAVFFLARTVNAQDLEHVRNLAPDSTVIEHAELRAALESFAPSSLGRGARPSPLNLTGNSCSGSFIVLSAANVAGLNGAYYKTELAIQTQWVSSSIKVNIFVVPNNTSPLTNPSAIGGGTYTLKGFTVYTWDNILSSMNVSGAGYVLVGIDSSTYNRSLYQLSAWANTYTASPGGGYFRTPVPIFTDGALFGADSYRHPNVTQDAASRNNIVVYNVDTAMSLTVDIRFHPYTSSAWSTYTVTLAPGESRQYSFASIFPGITGEGELALNYRSGGAWLGYVVRTDNGTNDGLLEVPYKCNLLSWPN